MIIIALTASIATASPSLSFWFMFYFGLGTIPALSLAQCGKAFFLRRFKNQAGFAAKFIALTVALLLMLRGAPFLHHHSMNHSDEIISTCKSPER
jgi:sulfite exporter TauE/SafE